MIRPKAETLSIASAACRSAVEADENPWRSSGAGLARLVLIQVRTLWTRAGLPRRSPAQANTRDLPRLSSIMIWSLPLHLKLEINILLVDYVSNSDTDERAVTRDEVSVTAIDTVVIQADEVTL